MPLWTPARCFSYRADNWGANPSATPGTSITPGASSVEGSWTASGLGTLAQEVHGIYVRVSDVTATAARNIFLDIGVDPAAGSSYVEVIANIICGSAPVITAAGAGVEFFFPLRIPSGATVGIRAQASNATPGTLRCAMSAFGQPDGPWLGPVGQYSETVGAGASTLGTSFTPGNAADGTYASLGTTTRECWWWQLGYQVDNATITAEYTYVELAYGDASNKHRILRLMNAGTTGETCGAALTENVVPFAAYCRVPAGSTLYVRGRTNNAPDSGYNAAAVGIGG